ncbi:hypothetical protein [Wolbachia endosymbiont of Wuchereria bancrofti]|uniref:hypothetical protein n=1 Tax=Wolbachia endosymbiont of Wuchereria bancrofti TaxID=96496 RepID=UPI000B7501DE|nr:hypothetical protein [Wolbachia endosymbiont of Wuchereria bancrofti]OWZ25077.1 mg chelatase-like domain protein [Wolbachia endosymbiont of Wuchereria bancrofti]
MTAQGWEFKIRELCFIIPLIDYINNFIEYVMITNINTVALQGINILSVNAQIHMANGVPAFNIVKLPDKTIAESKERIKAILN